MIYGAKFQKMYSPSCANAHHVATDLKVSGKFGNKKLNISKTEQFFRNIKKFVTSQIVNFEKLMFFLTVATLKGSNLLTAECNYVNAKKVS